MDRSLIQCFWNCGDDQIIQFAIQRAHLNKNEKEIIRLVLDECCTQEEAAEVMGYSTRRTQDIWYSATNKLLNIKWVLAYAKALKNDHF